MESPSYQNLINKHGGHFKISEFEIQGPVYRMNPDHFEEVVKFREWNGFSTLITSTWRQGTKSQHSKGLATDQILWKDWMQTPVGCLQHWLLATTWGFPGVGLYFDWEVTLKDGSRVKVPGIHIDNGEGSNRPLRWFCKEHEVNGQMKQFYYYQDLVTGRFHNTERGESWDLLEAIQTFNPLEQ